MTRLLLIAVTLLCLANLGAQGRDRERDTELDRAKRELHDAERAIEQVLADKAAAREKFDRLKARKGAIQAEIDAMKAQLAAARRPSDSVRELVASRQFEHDHIMADIASLTTRAAELDARVAGARGHADAVRGRLIREFESGRDFRLLAAEVDRSRGVVEQTKADMMRDLPRSQRYRWAEADVRHYEEEVRRLRASRITDPRRLADAERALADAKRNLDQVVADTMASDPAMQRATARLGEGEARLNQYRAGFSAELDRRRDVRDAAVGIATAEHEAGRTRQELAAAQAACATVKADLDRHTAHLLAVDRQLDRELGGLSVEIDRRQPELRKFADATFAAQDEFRRIGEAEDACRVALERAAKRVEWLSKRGR